MIVPRLAEVFFTFYFLYRIEFSVNIVLPRSWLNILFLIGSWMRIMKVYSNNFLRHWILKLSCTNVFLLVWDIKTISLIIGSRSWLKLIFNQFSGIFLRISISYRLKHTLSSWNCLVLWLRVIITNTWIRLLEININCDCFYEIERVFLVKWQTKFSFWVKFWNINVFLYWHWIILSWTHIQSWIDLCLSCSYLKSIWFGNKTVHNTSFTLTFHIVLVFNGLGILISSRSWLSVEVLLKLYLSVKPSLFHAKLLFLLLFGACISKRRERWVIGQCWCSPNWTFTSCFVMWWPSFKASSSCWRSRKWLLLIDKNSLCFSWDWTWSSWLCH